MKVFIVEDEIPAQIQLERLITTHYPHFEITGKATSIKATVDWLNKHTADLIFMDVELSDGLCFEIFKQTTVKSPVIIVTAYDNYAVKAFKINSIDYLLKPVHKNDFVDAVEKVLKRNAPLSSLDVTALKQILQPKIAYKERFTIKLGDRIIVLNVNDIAYFCAEDKSTFIITCENKKYLSDLSLDSIEELLDPKLFFRLTRGCIANINAIQSIVKYSGSRLKISLQPAYNEAILVSRVRIPLFLEWLEGR
ncbi:MAG: LytTR family DNA-binding domain-containing protein [Bacteroidales bacterium]|nr:LytTR family DNA-binding domain-containing protein [Bacteroidales bacterium]MCL2133668.1 LytTR family DNA-binding domain-containing protein [Bacteroidales bacterium]